MIPEKRLNKLIGLGALLALMSVRGEAWPGAAVGAGPSDQWFVMTLGGTPVGYVHESTTLVGNGEAAVLATDSTLKMVLNRLGNKVEIESVSHTEETPEGRLKSVAYEMRASVLSTKTRAVVKDGLIEIRNEAGGKTYARTIPFTGVLLGPEGVRRLSLERLKGPGDRIEFQTFAAEVESVSRGSQTALAWEPLHIEGREIRALKTEETLEAAGAKSTSWLDERRESVRQEMPTPFGPALIVPATRAQALEAAGGGTLPEEIYARSIIKTNVRLPQARTLDYVKLRITRRDPAGDWPDFTGPTQKATAKTAATLDLEVRRPALPPSVRRPVAVTEANREFLAPNAYIQSDDPVLRRTALDMVRGETDLWKAALRLERWVSENMRFDLGIAFAPSTELFKNRRGTCVGYATLLATLARAAGIPSRVAIGYVYALGMFGGHAWAEVLIGEAWIPIDAAIVAPGCADPARFYLTRSSLYEGGGSLTSGGAQQILGQVDVRILEFAGAEGRVVVVPEKALPYKIEGDRYENPWLGITITKPDGWVFTKLDAVWPEATVVGMEGADGAKAELQEAYLLPWLGRDEALRQALARLVPGGKERRTRIGEGPALAWESPEKAALAVPDGPQAWVFVVNGKNAPRILDELAAGWKLE
jgi:transglutaminase-like putative cysteine protease